jgi:hypothetical protein
LRRILKGWGLGDRWTRMTLEAGREAVTAGQLRGEFYESDSGASNVRWESTKYTGTHWIEAFIIKNGICVAKSGRKYVRIRG